MHLDTAHAARSAQGETVSGDLPFSYVGPDHFVLAVVDALGHGPKAHEAAMRAEAVLSAHAATASLSAMLESIHLALRGSRGAAMTLVRASRGEIEAVGVGNVGLRTLGIPIPFVPTPGVLGAQLRTPRIARAPLASGRLVLFSDGISSRFDLEVQRGHAASATADALLRGHGVMHDDATVLVADVTR